MAETTTIEWATATFNPWEGCARVSEGCQHCYAETRDKRMHSGNNWGKHAPRKTMSDGYWKQPLRWNRQAEAAGVRRRVFCASLADVFERHADDDTNDLLNVQRARLWDLIEATPNLDWLLLTKRPENIAGMVPRVWMGLTSFRVRHSPEWPDNVWIGTTIESPAVYDRLDHLRAIPARVRFVSAEPLLADISDIELTGISWVICGGESGPGARPMHPEWVRSLHHRVLMECRERGIDGALSPLPAFLFKQWGDWLGCGISESWVLAATSGGRHMEWKNETGYATGAAVRVGKKAAGRLLDGRTWDEVPS